MGDVSSRWETLFNEETGELLMRLLEVWDEIALASLGLHDLNWELLRERTLGAPSVLSGWWEDSKG